VACDFSTSAFLGMPIQYLLDQLYVILNVENSDFQFSENQLLENQIPPNIRLSLS